MFQVLLLWFALSIQSPNITPNPFDYEVSTGYDTKISFIKSDVKFEWERFNGVKYTNRSHNHDFKYLLVGEYVKPSKNISQQKAIIKYPFRFKNKSELNLGFASLWKDYGDRKSSLYANYKSKYLDVEISGLKQLDLFRCKTKIVKDINRYVFIEPSTTIFYSERFDYSVKIKLGYKFKGK